MSRIHVHRIAIALVLPCALWLVPPSSLAQQVADPSFDARVAKPTYVAEPRPKVLFDEAHQNFHTSDGRYKPFADLITHDGYLVTPNTQPFSRSTLEGFDLLVIANAMGPEKRRAEPAFTAEECDAVRDWVESGGALLLVADHYPMGSAAEILSLRFEVEMSKGMTDDPSHYDPALKDILFSRENGFLGDHPITNGRGGEERIARVVTFTGQSLLGPAGSVSFLRLADAAIDQVPPDRREVSAAGRSQGIALPFGKGRVVVLAEAGMLSAQISPEGERFGMNAPGIDNKQLALNVMHWLSGLLD
jgi:hypothetical protein